MRGLDHRLKLWRGVGAAALVGASLGLAACGGEGGEQGPKSSAQAGGEGGESGESAAPPPPPAPAASGGETGEAGAADAYAGLSGGARSAVRFQHLKGFLLVAQAAAKAGMVEEAGVLVGQGALEVFDAAPTEMPGLTRPDLDAVEQLAFQTPTNQKMNDAIAKASVKIDDLQRKGGGVDSELVRRMLALTRGLYGQVHAEGGGIDSVEYQHAFGAALGAQDALSKAGIALKAKDAARFATAQAEMAKLTALFPGPSAPETPASKRDLFAQIARVELALSGM
ncbi:MAG: hypothetical protein ACOYM8_02730 [Caulobacterales bacterium]